MRFIYLRIKSTGLVSSGVFYTNSYILRYEDTEVFIWNIEYFERKDYLDRDYSELSH